MNKREFSRRTGYFWEVAHENHKKNSSQGLQEYKSWKNFKAYSLTVTAFTTNCLEVAANVKVLSMTERSSDVEMTTSVLASSLSPKIEIISNKPVL